VPLEDEWAQYLRDLPQPSAIPQCRTSPQLAAVERRRKAKGQERREGGRGGDKHADGGEGAAPRPDEEVEVFVVPVAGVCGEERLLMTWLDESSAALVYSDITQAAEVRLPSESTVLHCEVRPLTQLILEPQLQPGTHRAAARAEDRYAAWRQSLPAGARARVAAGRPNILFIMVDSLSRGLAESALPETMSLLRGMQGGEVRGGREARGGLRSGRAHERDSGRRQAAGRRGIDPQAVGALHPPPSTLNPPPSTLDLQPSTLHPHPKHSTLNPYPQPSILNSQPSTLNPQLSTLIPQPSPPPSKAGGARRRKRCDAYGVRIFAIQCGGWQRAQQGAGSGLGLGSGVRV